MQILNSRWVSSSRDVVALRQTLLNPSSCSEFSAFVAVKGDTLESNIQFWLEVQKFKVRHRGYKVVLPYKSCYVISHVAF